MGYDTSAKPNVPQVGIWACLWCSATATIGLTLYFGTHVAHLHRSCTKPRPARDLLKFALCACTEIGKPDRSTLVRPTLACAP